MEGHQHTCFNKVTANHCKGINEQLYTIMKPSGCFSVLLDYNAAIYRTFVDTHHYSRTSYTALDIYHIYTLEKEYLSTFDESAS